MALKAHANPRHLDLNCDTSHFSGFLTAEGIDPASFLDRLTESCESSRVSEVDAVLDTVLSSASYERFVELMKRRAKQRQLK
jgi:hypothetical protein